MHTLDENLPYRIVHSKRAKRLALKLDPAERVFRLVVPALCPLQNAYHFASKHQHWMQERIENLPEPRPYIDGAILPLNGQDVRLTIDFDFNRRRTAIKLIENDLFVLSNQENPTAPIERYLKTYAGHALKLLSKEKSISISNKINKISIKDTKSRWGSCTSEGDLSYSWRLILAPPEAMDYVVAHEVAHLQHLDHSKKFWSLCRELSMDFLNGQYWMHNHGHELMCYGRVTSG